MRAVAMKPIDARGLAALSLSLMLAGCAGVDYHDAHAAVDARPECAGMGRDKTGEPLPAWCERTQGASWSSGGDDRMEVDFGGKDDER